MRIAALSFNDFSVCRGGTRVGQIVYGMKQSHSDLNEVFEWRRLLCGPKRRCIVELAFDWLSHSIFHRRQERNGI